MQNSLTEKQRVVMRFLTAEGVKPADTHYRMVVIYGEYCVSDNSVRKWNARFREDRVCLSNNQRPCRLITVITAEQIKNVNDLLRSDVTMRMLAVMVRASLVTV